MRGIPQGHDEQWLIFCHNCEKCYLQSNCSEETLVGYHGDDAEFFTSYNDRTYWLPGKAHEVTMWKCPNCLVWMWDPNDEDPETPRMYRLVPWVCGECGDFHIGKDEADQCCS